MLPVGVLSGMGAKIAAGVSASLLGITAAGAAGALPGPAQNAVASVVGALTPFDLPGGSSDDGGTNASVAASADHTTPGGQAAAGGDAVGPSVHAQTQANGPGGSDAKGSAAVGGDDSDDGDSSATGQVSAGLPSLAGVPSLPGLPGLPDVPSCATELIDPATGRVIALPTQVTADVINCVKTLVADLPLPLGMDQCVSNVLDYVSGVVGTGGVPTAVPGFDFSACVPVDVSKCMSSIFNSMPGFGGGIPGLGGGIPGLGGNLPIPQIDLEGCLPFNMDKCISSILGAVPGLASGVPTGVPNLDLSSCVPVGAVGGLPTGSWGDLTGLMGMFGS